MLTCSVLSITFQTILVGCDSELSVLHTRDQSRTYIRLVVDKSLLGLEITPCSPRAHPVLTPCSPHAHPVLTPCSPHAHPVLTPCSPRSPPPHTAHTAHTTHPGHHTHTVHPTHTIILQLIFHKAVACYYTFHSLIKNMWIHSI